MTDSPAKLYPPSAWRVWENPIFRRYTRSRLRMKGLLPGLLLTLILAVFWSLITPILTERSDEGRQRWRQSMEERAQRSPEHRKMLEQQMEWERRGGREWQKLDPVMYQRMALLPLLALQALILFVIGTGQVAGGMTMERDEGMVDYQRLAPMTPLAKTLGYLIGLPVREWVMFAATLPFTALALWRGQVPFSDWGPVALIFITSVLLYHLTGLVAGTVFKSRRWAFLLCMAMIFLLYFLVPQGSRLGLPFLRYVTMWPALMESSHLLPAHLARDWQMFSAHTPGEGVKFFQWNFSDVAFTLLVQGSFILTMVVMVWRKWRQADSHLLSKAWALLVFAWLCVLPLGNALPGIADGSLFPAQNLRRYVQQDRVDEPTLPEALLMCGFYGMLMLVLLVLLVIMLTPAADTQARGLRRAAKLGKRSAPFFSDAFSAFTVVLVLTMCAAASWGWFTHSVLASNWFHADPGWRIFAVFFGVLAPATLGLHALLESRGGKWPFLAIVFLGAVPLLTALVVWAGSRQLPTTAVIIGGASPLAQTFYAAEQSVPMTLHDSAAVLHNSARTALYVWPALYGAGTILGLISLNRHWRKMRKR